MTDLVATRRSLHAVAEHVLAAALHAATGRIGLRRTPGGFGTPWFPSPAGERRISVVGVELLVEDDTGERSQPLTTVGAAAAFAGVAPGGPAGVYELSTPLEPDAPLVLDAGAADRLAWWFAVVDEALARFTAGAAAGDDPAPVQLWPEHFDLATSAAEVNYGGSPGDDAIPEPYLYVGPWTPREGAFWDQPWGASRRATEVPDVAAAVAFLEDGRSRAAAGE